MRLRSDVEVSAFERAVQKSHGAVWLIGSDGSRFNLKSFISRYVALALLIQNCNNELCGIALELFCENKSDEANFFEFFRDNPGVLGDSREEFWQDV